MQPVGGKPRFEPVRNVIIKMAGADAEEPIHQPKGTHSELRSKAPGECLSPLQQLFEHNAYY